MNSLKNTFEEVRLVYKNRTKANDRPKVQSPDDAFKILYEHWDKDQITLREECKLLLLDNRMHLMSIADISSGGMTEAIVDPRIVFAIALKRRSHRVILAHNHPTGNLKPSNADIALTNRLSSLGKMMRIDLEDHLIITDCGYSSIMHDNYRSIQHG
jgi:DNA repair protein RadC